MHCIREDRWEKRRRRKPLGVKIRGMKTLIAEKELTAEASQERVWDLLGTLIFDSLSGLEKVEIIDENNFRAELRTKAFGIPLTWYLRGEMIDISPPKALSVKLNTKSKWDLITLVQIITFSLNSAWEGKAMMVCQAVAEDLSLLIRWLLLGQVKNLAKQIFDSIEEHLKQWA
jgi:hypothetical protein